MWSGESMFSRHLGYEIAIAVVICTVCLFLFPTVGGSYSAVHGPVTALRSLRLRLKLWLAIALAALRLLRLMLGDSSVALQHAWQKIGAHSIHPRQTAVLRC